MEKKKYAGTIVVGKKDVPSVYLAELYAKTELSCPDFEEESPILDYTVAFENGFELNVEFWNSAPPWVDINLFNEQGVQCVMEAPQVEFFGDLLIETDDAEYIVKVIPEDGWTKPEIRVTLQVPQKTLSRVQEALAVKKGCHPDYGRYDTIETVTVRFPNGMQADIKCCNGDTPYVDPVLFNADGSEIQVLEVEDDFLGEYWFEVNNVNLVVELTA